MGSGETIRLANESNVLKDSSKGVSKEVQLHFDNLQEKYQIGGTLRGLKVTYHKSY